MELLVNDRLEPIKQRYLAAEGANDVAAMEQAYVDFLTLDTVEGRMWAHTARGGVCLLTGDLNGARAEYMKRMEVFAPLGPSKDLLNTWTGLGRVAMYEDDMASAFEAFRHVLEIAEQIDASAAIAGANSNIGIVLQRVGDYVGALPYLQRGLELSRASGHRQFEANITNNLGMLYLSMQQWAEALPYFERAAADLEALGSQHDVYGVRCNIAQVLWRMGRNTEAESMLRENVESSQQDAAAHQQADLIVILAELLLGEHRVREAEELLDRYAEQIKLNGRASIMAERAEAQIYEHHGEPERAQEIYERQLERAVAEGHRNSQVDLHRHLSDLARKRRDLDAYIHHNEAYARLHNEVTGAEAARRYAVLEKQAELDALQQQQLREREILYSALPRSVADRLINGETVNDTFDHAAVLFLDIVGFTTHSSLLQPRETATLLAGIFNRFDEICRIHNVVKVKTIGDSYMCFAHSSNREQGMVDAEELKTEVPEVVERVAAVALAMLQAEFYWPTSGEQRATSERIQFRIGLHCGPVTAGVIGTEHLQYDVWGDTVNAASRMESTGEPGRIQVSAAFASALRNRYPISDTRSPTTTYWLEPI